MEAQATHNTKVIIDDRVLNVLENLQVYECTDICLGALGKIRDFILDVREEYSHYDSEILGYLEDIRYIEQIFKQLTPKRE